MQNTASVSVWAIGCPIFAMKRAIRPPGRRRSLSLRFFAVPAAIQNDQPDSSRPEENLSQAVEGFDVEAAVISSDATRQLILFYSYIICISHTFLLAVACNVCKLSIVTHS